MNTIGRTSTLSSVRQIERKESNVQVKNTQPEQKNTAVQKNVKKEEPTNELQSIKANLEKLFDKKINNNPTVNNDKVKKFDSLLNGIKKIDSALTKAIHQIENKSSEVKKTIENNNEKIKTKANESADKIKEKVTVFSAAVKKKFGPSDNKIERQDLKKKFDSIASKYEFGLSKQEKQSKIADTKNAIKNHFNQFVANKELNGTKVALKNELSQATTVVKNNHHIVSEPIGNMAADGIGVATNINSAVGGFKKIGAIVEAGGLNQTGVANNAAEVMSNANSAQSIATNSLGTLGPAIGGAVKVVTAGIDLGFAIHNGIKATDFRKMSNEFKKEAAGVQKEIKQLDKMIRAIGDPNLPSSQKLMEKRDALIGQKEALLLSSKEAHKIYKDFALATTGKSVEATAKGTQALISGVSLGAAIAGTVGGAAANTAVQATAGVVGAAAGGATGVIDIAMGSYGLVKDGISFTKSAILKKNAKSFKNNPPQAIQNHYEKKIGRLEKQLAKLEKKPNISEAEKSNIKNSIAKAKTKLEGVKADALIYKTATPEVKEQLNAKYGFNSNLMAVSDQTINRRALGFKGLGMANNGLKITAGCVSTGGMIATATGVGAPAGAVMTPIGWTMSAVGSINGVALGAYKSIKTLKRMSIAKGLNKQNEKTEKLMNNLSTSIKDKEASIKIMQSNPQQYSKGEISKLESEVKGMKEDLKELQAMQPRLELQMNKKDPKFAINTLIKTLNKQAPENASPQELADIKSERRVVKALLKNVYKVEPKTLMDIAPNDPNKTKLEKIQKQSIKKLEDKIKFFG